MADQGCAAMRLSRAAAIGSLPTLEEGTIGDQKDSLQAGVCPRPPAGSLISRTEVWIASPMIAVPPLVCSWPSAARVSAVRSVVGDWSTIGAFANSTRPTSTWCSGIVDRKWAAACCAAARRGRRDVGCLHRVLLTSWAIMIAPLVTGTATCSGWGRAAAAISTAIAIRNASIGRWRRQRVDAVAPPTP